MDGTTTDAPVLVVGAGPVGQTAALLLARRGVEVVVVDARQARDAVGSKAICQQRDVLDVWDSVGAGRQLAEEGVTWTTARTFHRDTELFSMRFVDRGRSPFPPFVNISQGRTEQVLDERIAEQSLVDLRWGHRVVALEQDDAGVRVRCETAAGPVDLRAAYVLGCTGARGGLRELLGLGFPGRSFDDQFLICDVRTDLPGWESERRFYFDPSWNPGRQVLIHPCPDSTYRIDWQVPPDYDLDDDVASGGLDRRIREVIGDRSYDVVWRSVYRFHSRLVSRMRVGRVLLAGDAAHLVAPFGARGLNAGVLDAENAAWKLAFLLRGLGGEELLESYHAERHAAARENLEVTTATMRFLVPQDEPEWARREQLLQAAGSDPQARAQVDSGRLAEPFWYVDSPLTTAAAHRPFPGRPEKGHTPEPGPGVLVPDAPVTVAGRPEVGRLRQLARGLDAADALLVLTDDAQLDLPEAPVDVHRLGDLDPTGALADALGYRPGEVWLVRPDAHVAAVLFRPTPDVVREAALRALGRTLPVPV